MIKKQMDLATNLAMLQAAVPQDGVICVGSFADD
jgi:hypothetical protein